MRLLKALAILDHNVVEKINILLGELKFRVINADLIDNARIGRNSLKIIDQAFFQIEHIQKMFVLHRFIELFFQIIGDLLNNLHMFFEMKNIAVNHFEDLMIMRPQFSENTPLKTEKIIRKKDDQTSVVQKHPK